MSGNRNGKENKLFVVFLFLAVIVGGVMLIWGQYNSAQQVFEIGFLNYRVDEQLANDEEYIFSEADAEQYGAMLEMADEWKNKAGGEDKSCAGETVTTLYGEFAAAEIEYTVYDNGSDTTVFLLHGYNEGPEDAAVFAPYWWDKGFNIIIPTLKRPMGEGVALTAFGVYERYDIYDIICAEGLEDDRVILHGRGTGAAAALLLAADKDHKANIDLIVSDSVFATLDGLKIEQLRAQFGLGEFLTGSLLTKIVNTQLGFELGEFDISEAAAASDVPKFFACGGADGFISRDETYVVYTAAAGEKALLTVDEAANRMVYTSSVFGADEYRSRLDEFLTNNLY